MTLPMTTANTELTDAHRIMVYRELVDRLEELYQQGIIGPEVKTNMLITWLNSKIGYEE